MSAQNTDKLRRGFFGSSTTLSASIGNTDTTIPVSSTTGWSTDTAIDVTIDRVDANGNKTPTKRETITLVVSGINGINALRGVEGTAQPHSAGAIVEITFTAATHNDQVNWGLKNHDQQGNHESLTDMNGNTILSLSPAASAVNNIQVSNAATGNTPTLAATGSDSNINVNLVPKGAGALQANGNNVWYYLGSAQITSNINTSSTSPVQATGLTATVTVPSGCKKIRATFYGSAANATAGDGVFISIWRGTVGSGVQVGSAAWTQNTASFESVINCPGMDSSPPSGSQTYNIGFSTGNASYATTIYAGALSSTNGPAMLIVEGC
jgi:hypothetical protein